MYFPPQTSVIPLKSCGSFWRVGGGGMVFRDKNLGTSDAYCFGFVITSKPF